MSPLQVVGTVGTPIALMAFVIAVAAYAYRLKLNARRKEIESAAEASRADLVHAALQGFSTVSTEGLTEDQRYDLTLKLIEARAAQFRIASITAVVLAIVMAIVVVAVGGGDEPGFNRLVVRLHSDAGRTETIRSGNVKLDVGPTRLSSDVTVDGDAAFDSVPDPLPASGLRLHATATGFKPTELSLDDLPEDGVIYLEMVRETYETKVFGIVIDQATNLPMPGVRLLIGDDPEAVVSDEEGAFQTVRNLAPGSTIRIEARLDGSLGFRGRETIQEGQPLSIHFNRGSKS